MSGVRSDQVERAVARDARWGRIVEGAGEDPYLGARVAAARRSLVFHAARGRWETEPGDFLVLIGLNSRDVKEARFAVR